MTRSSEIVDDLKINFTLLDDVSPREKRWKREGRRASSRGYIVYLLASSGFRRRATGSSPAGSFMAGRRLMANLHRGNKVCVVAEAALTPPVNLPFLVPEIKQCNFGLPSNVNQKNGSRRHSIRAKVATKLSG